MNANPSLLYRNTGGLVRNFDGTAHTPAVMNNKLEALKVLANSILVEISSLAQNTESVTQINVDLADEVHRYEADLIRCALTRTGGRQRRAAALLGIRPTTLHEKMKRFGMLQPVVDSEDGFAEDAGLSG